MGRCKAYSLGQNPSLTVTCLVRDTHTATALNNGIVPRLGNAVLPAPLKTTTSSATLADADMIYVVLPAAATIEALAQIEQHAKSNCPVILCAKGIVTNTNANECKTQNTNANTKHKHKYKTQKRKHIYTKNKCTCKTQM